MYFIHTIHLVLLCFFFSFDYPTTTEIYTLSLHDALPISLRGLVTWITIRHEPVRAGGLCHVLPANSFAGPNPALFSNLLLDRKSTRLNSSHGYISYAVFCLKKKTCKNKDN